MVTIPHIAVLVAPPLGHISRVTSLLKALSKHVDFKATFFVPRLTHFPHFEIEGHNVVSIPITSSDWIAQGTAYANALKTHNLSGNYDLVIYDTNPLQWLFAVDLYHMRTVCLTNIFLTAHANEPTLQVDRHRENITVYNQIRVKFNLPPLTSAYDLYEADLVLLADPQVVVDHYGLLPDHYKFCGGAFWSAPGEVPQDLKGISDILLVSLGSTGNRHKLTDEFVEKIKTNTKSKYVVLTGQPPAPDYADFIFEYIPINDILPHCRAVITQGGSGASYQALSKGVPVIVVPTHKNHFILGKLLQKLEIGIVVDQATLQNAPKIENFQTIKANLKPRTTSPNGDQAFENMARELTGFINRY
jgi:hypothetical protein